MDWKQSIANLKELTGLSLQKFATALDLSMTAVQNYLAGRQPSPKAIVALAMLAEKHGAHKLSQEFMSELLNEFPLNDPGVWASIKLKKDTSVYQHRMAVLWVADLTDHNSPMHSLGLFFLAFLAELGKGSKPALEALVNLAATYKMPESQAKAILNAISALADQYGDFAETLKSQPQQSPAPEVGDSQAGQGGAARRRKRKTGSIPKSE